MKTIKASIIGFGSVGQGVARVLLRKKEEFRSIGLEIMVVAVADSKTAVVDLEGVDLATVLERKESEGVVGDAHITGHDIIRDIEHDLVIETTPTNIDTGGVGLQNMLTAFSKKRHVVTSNKGPLALKYRELAALAEKSGCAFRFEATVGGAMPLLNLVRDTLAGNDVISIEGIFNGTCNYILTRMMEEHATYELMLAEAQELGIAEKDPAYDVEGIDTACKLVILANAIFGIDATYKDVQVTGISRITPEALMLAETDGYVIKLIGEVNKQRIQVAPRLVPIGHPLAVGGTMNVASLQTDLAGPVIVVGRGAGSIETASAILSDIVSICKE
ncbi:homoserine dehydrogenase [Methanomethylovorans hollandica DSM 15978]|uniref:Homoserine dehydrogenase n=1 Tax=Methanomethylovorans hollandica (strain DSM 15978 / NBRC 107637 / DMS1) TaxID=867904 RepID=L0L0H8_METHD|nr:homoserine dehydrogenase [Methanomethylovorans hollandica]AGB49873.1 homoserine dehydrogenase [Methanomethylovorans hollandica DSM 15978]